MSSSKRYTEEADSAARRKRRAFRRSRHEYNHQSRKKRRYSRRYEDFFSTDRRDRDRTWRRRRFGNIYRDSGNGKICGVCAGVSDYLGVRSWKVRLAAVILLIFFFHVTLLVYFAAYFLLDDKPYYRQVTDRFEDHYESSPGVKSQWQLQEESEISSMNNEVSRHERDRFNNVRFMRNLKDKFSDLEDRIREMETHVTSSRFELQRAFNRISDEGTP